MNRVYGRLGVKLFGLLPQSYDILEEVKFNGIYDA